MSSYSTTIERIRKNKARRNYPGQQDPRCRSNAIFPSLQPKFLIDFEANPTVFTIGSCFAREIEDAIAPLGVNLPTKKFSAPLSERGKTRPNSLLNEYNPGAMSQRIIWALEGKSAPVETIVPSGESYVDLLLPAGYGVTHERALNRRQEIFEIYESLASCDVVVITLGLVEIWYDQEAKCYLNRMPPHALAAEHPDRFIFKRLDISEAYSLLTECIKALAEAGKKVILTVSPVPLTTTFDVSDAVIANEYSKSVLRICADRLSRNFTNVDYFPSYEIARSAGLSAYIEDNIHVRPEIVKEITTYMIENYRTRQPSQS